MVVEILRFGMAFYAPIAASAPHIYLSALPFMPTNTALWRGVNGRFPNLLGVTKGRMESWPGPQQIWIGHTHNILCVIYSPDGSRVVSCSADHTIRIWDAATGTL